MIKVRTSVGEETLSLAEFEERVTDGLVAPDTLISFSPVTGDQWARADSLELFGALYRPELVYFRRRFHLGRFPWITASLVALCALVHLYVSWGLRAAGPAEVAARLVSAGAKATPLILDLGETWRLLSSHLLHRDLLHLVFNCFVLFNVGGALENAYRRADYLLLIVVSALGAAALSLWGTPLPSYGASGIVFGCLGAVVVFGLRFSDALPPQYRGFFGLSAAPYVLIFLWMGWMGQGVDNWSHLGGLLAGGAVAAGLRPRRLDPGYRRWVEWARGGAALALVAVVALWGPLGGAGLGAQQRREIGAEGLSIPVPQSWAFERRGFGEGYGNGLPAPTFFRLVVEEAPTDAPPPRPEVSAAQWFEQEIMQGEHLGQIFGVRRSAFQPGERAGCPAFDATAAFEVAGLDRAYQARMLILQRGRLSYLLFFAAPAERYEAYHPVFERMISGLRLDAPESLLRARRLAEAAPGQARAQLRLGEAARRIGAHDEAAQALRAAARLAPGEPRTTLALARLLLDRSDTASEGLILLDELTQGARWGASELRAALSLGLTAELIEALPLGPDPAVAERLSRLQRALSPHVSPL